jgi:hypothetical protein
MDDDRWMRPAAATVSCDENNQEGATTINVNVPMLRMVAICVTSDINGAGTAKKL